MNIIIDDDLDSRVTPYGFKRFTNGFDLLQFMEIHPSTHIEHITFDNDLGTGLPEGYDIVKEMVGNNWHVEHINIHSANVVAVENMMSYISSAKKAGVFEYESLTQIPLSDYSQNF